MEFKADWVVEIFGETGNEYGFKFVALKRSIFSSVSKELILFGLIAVYIVPIPTSLMWVKINECLPL